MKGDNIVESLLDSGYELFVEPIGDGKMLLINRRRKETVTVDVMKWSETEWEQIF